MKQHQIITSDAGDVYVDERCILGVWLFIRNNKRPVNPGHCHDVRIEQGIRIGSWCLLFRRTRRIYDKGTYPNEWLKTSL